MHKQCNGNTQIKMYSASLNMPQISCCHIIVKIRRSVTALCNDLYQLVHLSRLGKDFDAYAHLWLRKSAGKKRKLHFFLCFGQLSPAGWQCVTEVSW